MKATNKDKLRLSILAALSVGVVAPFFPPCNANAADQAAQASGAQNAPPADASATTTDSTQNSLSEIVVTGSTSKRTLLDASVDITPITSSQIETKAPRSTADVLQLIPGIFVESTAGPVSNNYSVRGLPGGGQTFITLEEDGMPVLYGGGGGDEYFQNDITIDRVEGVEGGTAGILAPNGAGAMINFISKPINFDKPEGSVRLTAATYGEYRSDLFYSAPIQALGDGVGFMFGGYFDSTKGVRSSPFTFQTYHFKTAIEKKWDNGAFVKVTYKRWDEHDPYYADMPYQYVNGRISGVPGLNPQSSNITGPGFASIPVPDSCFTGNCFRDFSSSNGIHATGNQYRIDVNVPLTEQVNLFLHSRYLQSNWDFNGVFPGSGSGNAGLATAVDYLTPGALSPIGSVLTNWIKANPTTTGFGLRNLSTGQLIAASNVAALNALNGNGLLQQTVLNQQYLATRDLGNDFGVKWNFDADSWSNSLTVGGMYYRVRQYNDQSGVATLLNGVSNASTIYDIQGLNASGGVVGSLTNNGLLNYGDWGQGIWSNTLSSLSEYVSDEAAFLDKKLHVDAALRREDVNNVLQTGNPFLTNPPVPAGIPGTAPDLGQSFNGTYTRTEATYIPTSWTVGANYAFTNYLSMYGRYENGNETNGGNNLASPPRIGLSEVGMRYGGYGVVASLKYFHTTFNNQNYAYIDPANPALSGSFQANSTTNGIGLDGSFRPTFDMLSAFSLGVNFTWQQPKLSNVFLGQIVNGQTVNSAAAAQYNGKTPQRTPQLLYSLQPQYDLPGNLGSVYLRYEYTGKIYADSGDGLALPGYGVLSVGGNFNVADNLNLNLNVWNVTNQLGLTEGNPRQGVTQEVVGGYFYGRGIVGPNAMVSLTYKF